MKSVVVPKLCSSGTDAMLKFFTSGVDVAYMGVVPFTLARMFGIGIVPLRACGIWTEAVCLRARPSEGSGPLRIAAVSGSNAHLLAWEWAKTLDRKVLILDLEPADQLAALESGLVDGIATWEPFVSRVLKSGSNIVYSASDLGFAPTDLLCCSTGALSGKASSVAGLERVHTRASSDLVDGLDRRNRDILESLIGVDVEGTWRPGRLFPPAQPLVERDTEALRGLVTLAESFLRDSGLAAGLPDLDPVSWGTVGEQQGNQDEGPLTVGYANDPMCAPFYVGQYRNYFADEGVSVEMPKDLQAERIARLSDEARVECLALRDLVESDPELAVMKTGRIVERELLALYSKVFSSAPPKRISATLAELEENEVLPPLLASSADWIRRVRNVATHGSGTARDTAAKAFAELLEYLEWSEMAKEEVEPRCGRCKSPVQSHWKSCPNCTADLVRTCASCGIAMKSGWKICPECGE